jgi:hypothetical protein
MPGRYAWKRGVDWDLIGTAGSPGGVGIERECPQLRRAPARNPVALAVSRARIRKGVGGGGGWGFIGWGRRRLRQELNRN